MIDTKLAFVESKVTVIIRMNIVRTDIPRKAKLKEALDESNLVVLLNLMRKFIKLYGFWPIDWEWNVIYFVLPVSNMIVFHFYSDIHDWHTSQMGGSIPILINHILLVRPCQSFNRCQKVFKLAVNCFQEAFYILI